MRRANTRHKVKGLQRLSCRNLGRTRNDKVHIYFTDGTSSPRALWTHLSKSLLVIFDEVKDLIADLTPIPNGADYAPGSRRLCDPTAPQTLPPRSHVRDRSDNWQDVADVIKRVVYYGAQSCVSTGGPKEGVVEITANFVRRLSTELLADLQSILGQGLVLAFCEASDDSETLFVYIRDGV